MKVKIMYYEWDSDFEKQINDFIKDKKIIDIKYDTSSVLIMYEE